MTGWHSTYWSTQCSPWGLSIPVPKDRALLQWCSPRALSLLPAWGSKCTVTENTRPTPRRWRQKHRKKTASQCCHVVTIPAPDYLLLVCSQCETNRCYFYMLGSVGFCSISKLSSWYSPRLQRAQHGLHFLKYESNHFLQVLRRHLQMHQRQLTTCKVIMELREADNYKIYITKSTGVVHFCEVTKDRYPFHNDKHWQQRSELSLEPVCILQPR